MSKQIEAIEETAKLTGLYIIPIILIACGIFFTKYSITIGLILICAMTLLNHYEITNLKKGAKK